MCRCKSLTISKTQKLHLLPYSSTIAATSSASTALLSKQSVTKNRFIHPTTAISPNSQLSLSSKISLTPSISLLSHNPCRHLTPATPRQNLTVSASVESKPTVLVAEKLGEAGLDLLKSFAIVDCSYNLSPEELCTKISLCDALIVRSGTKVTREVFESSAGRLKVVGRAGVGIDNVDLGAATEHGCLVVIAPTANTIAAAEHGIALLTAMSRNVAQADASVKAGEWKRNKYVGVSLVGKKLAVLGFGKVGSEVARRAKGLGMHVIAHDPYAPADRARAIGVDLVSFEEALATADFISLHMPLTSSTTKVLNDDTFAKMKKGVMIVNVARGGVIDEDALVRALDSGIVAQAALDVFTQEPPAKDSKLIQHERVTATPHLGASTMEAQEGVALEIAEAVIGALNGELAATAVNAPMVSAEGTMALVRFSASRNKNCECGFPMARLTSWTRENPGRKFKACKFYDPTTESRGCKSFEWVDEDDGTKWQRDVINQLLLDKKLQRGEINSLKTEVEHLSWQRRCLLNENEELKLKCKSINAGRKTEVEQKFLNVGSIVVATVICCVAVFVGILVVVK